MNKTKVALGIATLLQLLLAFTALALVPPAPEPVLIPVAVSHAVDSRGFAWTSDVSFLFTGEAPTVVLVGVRGTPLRIEAGGRGSIPISDEAGIHGLILYVPPADVRSLFVTSHVYRADAPVSGAVIPLVRRSDLVPKKPVNLLSVPVSPTTRTLVRIYDMSLSGDTDVLVNTYLVGGDLAVTVVFPAR
ncbi:MAG TPA: hypothetical protein VGJ82_06940 [Thermoanaerobaculia bacterium]|jgi:hypothetical protein